MGLNEDNDLVLNSRTDHCQHITIKLKPRPVRELWKNRGGWRREGMNS